MIIQCPACGARAKLPDSKEGAKVRCVECEKIYVAGPPGAKGGGRRSQQTSTAMPIAIGAGIVILILVLVITKGGGDKEPLPDTPVAKAEAPPAKVENLDISGWDSALVKRARKFHDLAFAGEEYDLQTNLAWPLVWDRVQAASLAAGSEGGEAEANASTPTKSYASLSGDEIDTFRGSVLKSLVSPEAGNLVGNWMPFDGTVISESETEAQIRMELEPRSESMGNGTRGIEWHFVLESGKWKPWSWERYISDGEQKAAKVKRKKSYAKKTLTDGSQVIEAEPGPIAYMEETPQATRDKIDALILSLIDLELPAKQLTKVKGELLAYGKPAIPPLLTKFYEMNKVGFDDIDQAIAAQLVHSMLSEITGYVTTFSAHEALGATEERRESGVRQWFGWYNRKFKKFEAPTAADEGEDALEEALGIMSDKERREYEKTLRRMKSDEENKNPHRKNN